MALLAQADGESIEFGTWGRDAVFWLVEHGDQILGPVGDFGEWLVNLLVDSSTGDGYLSELPWLLWPIAFAVIGLLTRRPTRGLRAAIALVAVHALGPAAVEDVPFSLSMTVVGVGLGTVAAVPVSLVAYFSTGLRRLFRRVSDAALIVVMSSTLLPLVFIFGLGTTTAVWTIAVLTIAPMTKAFVLALTSIRTDRAVAGSEVAAGLNTSVLLTVILQGSFALIGAGGLGRLLFRATNNLNLGSYVSASAALLAVAIAFDQITRPSRRDGTFLDRTHQAWNLPVAADDNSAIPPTYVRTTPPTVVGAIVALISLLLPWSSGRGTLTSHVRQADLSLPDRSFNGIAELGGSGFGVAIGVLAGCTLLGVLARAIRRNGPPADFTTVTAVAIVVISLAFLTTAAAPFAASAGLPVGAIVALVGGLLMLFGSLIQGGGGSWFGVNGSARLGYAATLASVAVAGFLIVLGSTIGWVVDFDPPQPGMSLDIEAEIDRLTEDAGDDINKQIAAAQAIQNLINNTQEPAGPVRTGGLHVDGPHTAFTVLLACGLAAVALLVALAGRIDRARWLAYGLAFGAALTCAAWISSTTIAHDDNLHSDGGPFLAMLGAASLAAVARRAPLRSERNATPATADGTSSGSSPESVLFPDLAEAAT